MMKKLLAVMLVLCVTSVANAGLLDLVITSVGSGPDPITYPIPPTKEITLMPSQWIDLDIQFTGTPAEWLVQLSVEITAVGIGTLDLSALTLPEGVWDLDALYSPGVTEVVAGKQYLVTYSFGMAGSGIWGTDVPEWAVDHIFFHCDDAFDDVIITMVDYASPVGPSAIYENMAPGTIVWGEPVIVHQVPEPMTIALLGLGGLFLLRRRKWDEANANTF